MLFILFSDKKYDYIINPLIKSIEEFATSSVEVFGFTTNQFYLFDSFNYAIQCGLPANYLNEKIKNNVWWTEDIDNTIKSILNEILNGMTVYPIFSKKYFADNLYYTVYENERKKILKAKSEIKIYNKNIGGYFYNEEFTVSHVSSYKSKYRGILKSKGYLEKEYTIEYLEKYLEKLFNQEYEMYIPIIFDAFFENCERISFSENMNPNIANIFGKTDYWENIFFAEEYFNGIRIYGLEQSTKYDFPFQRDENNEYFVQYQYSASESVTGRMFPIKTKSYQPLQTLTKEDRFLLKSEKGCIFLEYDYKNFELSLIHFLYCFFYSFVPAIENPHEYICLELGLDPVKHRQIGKSINYAIVYGMTFSGIVSLVVEHVGIELQQHVENVIQQYPFYNWSKAVGNILEQGKVTIGNGTFIQNGFGRLIKIEKEHALLNNFNQSTAADILYSKVSKIVDVFKHYGLSDKNKILLQNHDSILIQLNIEECSENSIINYIHNCMKEKIGAFEPKIDLKTGYDWGNLL